MSEPRYRFDMEAERELSATCDTCGAEAVMVVGDLAWCEACYHICGSCCADP